MTQQEIDIFTQEIETLISTLNLVKLNLEKDNLQKELEDKDNWNNNQKLTDLSKLSSSLGLKIEKIKALVGNLENLQIAYDLKENEEFTRILNETKSQYEELKKESFLNGEFDQQNAEISIHAGAGGLDAQDWAAMLASMYQAFFKNQSWSWEIISFSPGEEGGLKSIFIEVKGIDVYGYLKEEAGVHRLVRISPFNAGKTRETSFALVEVLPSDLESKHNLGEIPEKDLKWEYSMSSGKGGQSVNTTYSAVRLVHLPTNISVTCQNERSQLQNKQQALRYLKNKLVILELQKNQDLKSELKGVAVSAQWGSQIRSYVLHPYKLVKDVRSGFETTDTVDIIELGNILPIIWSVKASKNLEK